MKIKAVIFASVVLVLLALTQLAYATCYDSTNPFDLTKQEIRDCPLVAVTSDASSGVESLDAKDNMFQVKFTCGVKDKKVCNKVKDTFKEAGRIITQTLVLKEPIVVNASFIDICDMVSGCENTLGAAAPSRNIELLDEDGTTRLYPQALVKQFQFKKAPKFSSIDILTIFNSRFDFYFFGDTKPIRPDQTDLLAVVLHEYLHGLGYTSGWSTYIQQKDKPPSLLTPFPQITKIKKETELSFIEFAFDRYIFTNPKGRKQPMTKIANDIKEFSNTAGATGKNLDKVLGNFIESAQGKIAKRILKSLGTTPDSMAFVPTIKRAKPTILETSLDPYAQGSSISHADYKTYADTSDFLMVAAREPGATLQDLMDKHKTKNPIGPNTLALLNTLGYATKDHPNPYKPCVP